LIGDVNKAFLDPGAVRNESCEIHTEMPAGIDAAGRNDFAAIGIVMAGISARLSSALKSLRQANQEAKIILLAQMYEEPIAQKLVGSTLHGTSLADDYLICPLRVSALYGLVRPGEVEAAPSTTVDAALERKIEQLERLATEDDLTGLKNRRYIWEFSRQILEHARKESGRVTLLVFDIDNFKHYNDVYGHSVGDKILKQAAILMRRCCRSHDVVGRIGGDEFAVVFWDDPQRRATALKTERRLATAEPPKEPIFIAKRFQEEFEKAELHLLGPKGEGVLTISGGLAGFPRDGSTIQQLFQQADRALLEAKRSGKNRIYLVGKPQSDIADIE
jgi:two-component system cell cycle response regulator